MGLHFTRIYIYIYIYMGDGVRPISFTLEVQIYLIELCGAGCGVCRRGERMKMSYNKVRQTEVVGGVVDEKVDQEKEEEE